VARVLVALHRLPEEEPNLDTHVLCTDEPAPLLEGVGVHEAVVHGGAVAPDGVEKVVLQDLEVRRGDGVELEQRDRRFADGDHACVPDGARTLAELFLHPRTVARLPVQHRQPKGLQVEQAVPFKELGVLREQGVVAKHQIRSGVAPDRQLRDRSPERQGVPGKRDHAARAPRLANFENEHRAIELGSDVDRRDAVTVSR